MFRIRQQERSTGSHPDLARPVREYVSGRVVAPSRLRSVGAQLAIAQPEDVIEPIQDHFVMGDDDDRGALIDGDPALCEYFIEEAKVAVVPGSAFYAPGYVRLSYATSQANIEKGLSRIGEALAKLK